MVPQIPQVVTKTWASKRDPWLFLNDTVDGSEIPKNHRLDVQNLVNNGINYQPQLVIAGFLNPSTVSKDQAVQR